MSHYVNGKWVEEDECKISVFDITVLRGYGIFEFLRTYNKVPFMAEAHLDRFFTSANELGIPVPLSRSQLQGTFRLYKFLFFFNRNVNLDQISRNY